MNAVSATSTRMGQCSVCWNKGMPSTPITAPPMSRCVDRAACEARRLRNAERYQGKTEPQLVTKLATVETMRRNRVHYFHVVRKFAKNEHGEEFLVREDLELVPDRKNATKFPPEIANRLARIWNALAREV